MSGPCRFCRFTELHYTVSTKAMSYYNEKLFSLASPYKKMAAQLEMMIEAAKGCKCHEAKD